MKLINVLRWILSIVVLTVGVYGWNYLRYAFPIITGYESKIMCSAVFVSGRSEEDVRRKDLGHFPLNLGVSTVNHTDSSVTSTLWGMAAQTAYFRPGAGATLVQSSQLTDFKNQKTHWHLPDTQNRSAEAWPMGDAVLAAFPKDIDSTRLNRIIAHEFESLPGQFPQTRAIVVLYKGQLIAEKYGPGFSAKTPLLGWSMAKSVTSALTGILVKKGLLTLDTPAPVVEWSKIGDPRHKITIRNLLQQNTGLDFSEEYSRRSDATRMLFEESDMAHYAASKPLKVKPGIFFHYSSGNTNILARILRTTVGELAYPDFAYTALFQKIGIFHATFEPDPSGTLVGSSYLYAPARDWARFGLLYAQHGLFNGEQILTPEFIRQSVTPASSATQGQYGFLFWLNRGVDADSSLRKLPHVPRDAFYADGFEGQIVCVIPSKELVIVRLGLSTKGQFDADPLIHAITQLVP